jgi:hypothetical protein
VAHVVVRAELRGLEDHLQVGVAADVLHADYLLHHPRVVTREERLARDDHVDLVGAGGHGVLGVAQLHVERRLA